MKSPRPLTRLLLLAALACALPGHARATPSQAVADNPRAIVVENVSQAGFAVTLERLKQQLETDGWNLVAEINLGARLAKKNVAIPGGLVILELTSGKNAVPLLKEESTRYVAALMPCSVAVYGMNDGRVVVSRLNAGLMAGMMEPRIADVMKGAAIKLDETIARALAQSGD